MKGQSRTFALWLMIIILGIVLYSLIYPINQGPKSILYSEFIKMAEQGQVEHATIIEKNIEVEFKDHTKPKVKVYAPEDPDLIKILRQANVMIEAKEPVQSFWPMILQFIMYGVPLFIIVWWFLMIRQMQGGGAGGALSFGKSKAKMFIGGPSKITFVDVAGVDEAKEELKEIIDFLKDPKKYQRLGGRIPKGVLLIGPTGTGKTLLAKAVAGEAGVPFFSVSGSDFVEMFVGVGASRVRDLFDQGRRNAPCIIFVDEIDAVGRQRGAGLGGGHDEREQTLNQLLVEIDGFDTTPGVILIASTNRPDVLDPALLRPGRFDRQVVVDRPDLLGRVAILKVHTRKVILVQEVDLQTLARRTPGFSGADLANLVNEAALLAARRDKKAVEMSELEEAIDRVMAGPERKSRVMSEKEKKTIAFHECGHALVTHYTAGTNPVHKISIIPRGHAALGYTLQLPLEDRFIALKSEILGEICVLLGGRAAEEIVFKEISTGAHNDLERATETAHKMVCEYGMSKRIGTLTLGRKEEQVFLGRDLFKEKNYSEKTAEKIDEEVSLIINQCYQKAKNLLNKNKKKLSALANVLLEKEILDRTEVEKILGVKKTADRKEEPARKNPEPLSGPDRGEGSSDPKKA